MKRGKRRNKALVKRRIWRFIWIIVLITILYFAWGYVRSLYLESTWMQISIETRTTARGTVRVAQLTDLHRAEFGKDNQELVALTASKQPDIIVTTGDMIDIRTQSLEPTLSLYERLLEIAPVVYSLGNHEVDRDVESFYALLDGLYDMGVQVVSDEVATVRANGVTVRIGGIYHEERYPWLIAEYGPVDILLCHFPHEFDTLATSHVPLMFSGHTHGGQFRLPLMDVALYAPGQGIFPKYTKGLYTVDDSRMIVSRGLGNSSFPFRIHNPPEIIIADITFVADDPSAD